VCLLGEPAEMAYGRERLNHPMLPNHGTITLSGFNMR
jgi:hypothetical protein